MTHVVIDLLGDVLLAHDAYDDITHASRPSGAIALGVFLLVMLAFAMRAAFLEARGSEGALLTLLRRAQPRSAWSHYAAVTLSSLALVAIMEWCDAAAAGHRCDDIAELFGGSLLLAALTGLTVSACVTALARLFLRRLTVLHRALVALAEAWIRIARAPRSRATFDWCTGRGGRGPVAMFGSRFGGRAPPVFPSLVKS